MFNKGDRVEFIKVCDWEKSIGINLGSRATVYQHNMNDEVVLVELDEPINAIVLRTIYFANMHQLRKVG